MNKKKYNIEMNKKHGITTVGSLVLEKLKKNKNIKWIHFYDHKGDMTEWSIVVKKK